MSASRPETFLVKIGSSTHGDGYLEVSPGDSRHASIDLFFRDLALAHRERAFCVVLPVVEMPQKLLELWRNAREITLPSANDPHLQTTASVSERDAAR